MEIGTQYLRLGEVVKIRKVNEHFDELTVSDWRGVNQYTVQMIHDKRVRDRINKRSKVNIIEIEGETDVRIEFI